MTKYQLEHFENKVERYFRPLIDEQQLLIKQYRTEATNNVVKKLAKKMGADKILAKMKEAEEFMLQAQRDAKTFFEKKKSLKCHLQMFIFVPFVSSYVSSKKK